MKKAITILAILAIVVCAVFAENDPEVRPNGAERITVITKVDREIPILKLVGSLSDAFTNPANSNTVKQEGFPHEGDVTPVTVDEIGNANNGGELDATSKDISHEDVKAYFKVTSTAARCDFVYTITVTATNLKSTTQGVTYEIPAGYTFANQLAGTDLPAKLDVEAGGDEGRFTATATYTGETAATTIGTFDITWAKDIHAPEATYKADVTMTYSVE